MEMHILRVFGVNFNDPATFFTDLFIAFLCVLFYYRLSKLQPFNSQLFYWRLFFIFFGIATFLAGFAHLFIVYSGIWPLIISWLLSGISVFFIQLFSILLIRESFLKKILYYFSFLQIIFFILLLLNFKAFFIVKIHTTFSLIGVVLIIHLYYYFVQKTKYSKFIILGIAFTSLTALIHNAKLSFGYWFNHNDISHMVLAFCLYLFFLGCKALDKQNSYLQ